jgi:hypothetical protein
MRKLAAVVTMVALTAGVGLVAAPAGASAPAKNTKFCKALSSASDNIDALPTSGTSVNKKQAAATAKAIRKAAKSAPPKIKSALNTLADAYQRLADGDSIIDVIASDGLDYAKALGTFGKYYAKNCTSLTDLTQPG